MSNQAFPARDITLCEGSKCTFTVLKGEVLEQARSTRTSVNQLAPAFEHVPGQGVVVVPGRLYSTHEAIQEVWVKLDDGREEQFDLSIFAPFPVRAGHRVHVVTIRSGQTEGQSYLAGVRNDTTGETRQRRDLRVLNKQLLPNINVHYLGSWLLNVLFSLSVLGAAGSAFAFMFASHGQKGGTAFAWSCAAMTVLSVAWFKRRYGYIERVTQSFEQEFNTGVTKALTKAGFDDEQP